MADQENSSHDYFSSQVIHRSQWIVQGMLSNSAACGHKVLEDGAIVIADGIIQSVGLYRDVKREFSSYQTLDHGASILVPALINAHCHLELSHLKPADKKQDIESYTGDMTVWIRNLLAERERFLHGSSDAEKLILQHARKAMQDMSSSGVGFIGDVGNSLASRNIGKDQDIRVCFLLEILGMSKDSEARTFTRLENIAAESGPDIEFTPHAPYSTTPGLIRAMKERALRHKHIVSIHVAESMQEVEFLQTGRGKLREFLVERGGWDGSFAVPEAGPVEYLDNLGIIDDRTLCVHVVHVNHAEINILAAKKAKVCLCPGSNRFLGVGKAPVTEFLERGILPALGTDSRASNEKLNLWREMRLLREDHPGLAPETVFAMVTRGGAEAWGISSAMGTLEPGKQAEVLAVKNKEKINSPEQIFEFLTSAGETVQSKWLN